MNGSLGGRVKVRQPAWRNASTNATLRGRSKAAQPVRRTLRVLS